MKPSDLTPFVYGAAVVAWICAVLLVQIARTQPRIPVLVERAWVSVAVAVFLSIYAAVILNVDLHYPILDDATGRIISRLAAISLVSIPVGWLGLYLVRR